MATGTIDMMKPVSLSPTLTRTTGAFTVASIGAYQCGNIIQLALAFDKSSASVSAGQNCFEGTLSGVPLPNVDQICMSGFSGERVLTIMIKRDGSVIIRTNAAIPSGASTPFLSTGGIYMC